MKSYVIDSYAMIAYFEDEPGAELVSQILREIRDKKAKGFMCVINWGEIYYNVMREVGEGKAKKVLEKLNSYRRALHNPFLHWGLHPQTPKN